MDRYQDEIRRVAAKSGIVVGNNIARRLSNGSDISSHGSSSSSSSKSAVAPAAGAATSMGGVNVALARMEYQQKVNQLNLSNTLNSRQMQQAANNRSATMMSRTSANLPMNGTSSLRAISKSNSASSLIHGNDNGHVDNVTG